MATSNTSGDASRSSNMQFLVVFALLPMAMCLPSFPSEEKLKYGIKFLAQKFASSDLTRQACEAECQKYIDEDNKEINVAFGCPLACAGIQAELEKVVSAEQHHSKRASWLTNFLHRFHIDGILQLETLKQDLQIALDAIGSQATETACENECRVLIHEGHVLKTGCPFFCQSFKQLVNSFHLHKDTTTAVPPTTT